MKRSGRSEVIVTYNLRSYGAAIGIIGNDCRQEIGRRFTKKLRIPIGHFDRENGPCCASGKSDVFKNSPPFIFSPQHSYQERYIYSCDTFKLTRKVALFE